MSIVNLSDLENKELAPGIKGRFVHSENMTLAYWTVEAGAIFPEHKHMHEQVVNMIEGELELSVRGSAKVIEEGYVIVIPSETIHSGRAITSCRIIDVFYPIREDYKK